jgi:hypothetical protein
VRSRRLLWSAAIFSLLVGGALAYGYWHARTHGSLYVSLQDDSLGRYGEPVKEGVIELLDASGGTRITLTADGRHGAFLITAPAPYDCHVQERAAAQGEQARAVWQACFQRQSRWLADVAPSIVRAEIRFGRCELHDLPAQLGINYGDWFLWWVPLPHVGGKPYASFSRTFHVDGRTCRMPRPRSGTS